MARGKGGGTYTHTHTHIIIITKIKKTKTKKGLTRKLALAKSPKNACNYHCCNSIYSVITENVKIKSAELKK